MLWICARATRWQPGVTASRCRCSAATATRPAGSSPSTSPLPFPRTPERPRRLPPATQPYRLAAGGASSDSEALVAHAGARPWDRDAVDRRLINEVRSGGGLVIDSEGDVGG